MERRYLGYVQRRDQPAVRLLGARWDAAQGRWYIGERADPTPLRHWLEADDRAAEAEYSIISDEATVVGARTPCWNCRRGLEVICLYCQSGLILGEAALHFTVSNITATDASLRRQLRRWPNFRPVRAAVHEPARYANHCPGCAKSQDDFYLHCRPEGVFFSFAGGDPARFQIHVLQGLVRLSGDEGFEP